MTYIFLKTEQIFTETFFFFFQFVHVTTNLLRSDLDKPDESKNNSSLVSVLTRDNSYLSLRI